MRRVEHIQEEMRSRPQGYEAAVLAGLVDLMVFLSRCYSSESVGEGQALLKIGEVLGLLEGRYEEQWHLDDLCAIARMGKSKLTETFRSATGQSPIDYLIHVRLRQAMKLLRETDRTVTDIAYSTGFSDSNYLARKFRDVLHTTPTAYRSANRIPPVR
jgi:transcriptional regulator GlxA family with amidase domain